jgi:HEPN domain-containing protein
MTPVTREWVDKAEGDYVAVSVLLRSRKHNRYDVICFHAQQCAEKYLKARLNEANIPFPKTHELSVLLPIVLPVEPLWAVFAAEMRTLETWAVLPRYPGFNATAASARTAVKICRSFRDAARQALGVGP